MTQTNTGPADTSDKKDAAKFFNTWMNSDSNDKWDEVCFQWCKQQQKARANQADPNCSMLCLKRPASEQQGNEGSWNPLKGYAVTMLKGKNDCVEHTNDMRLATESSQNIETTANEENMVNDSSIKYELDLGNVWSETENKAKRIVNSTFIPYYNYAVEQAIGWKDSPQGTQFQNTIKEKASTLLGYVYPLSPLETSADFQINKDMSPSDNKKE